MPRNRPFLILRPLLFAVGIAALLFVLPGFEGTGLIARANGAAQPGSPQDAQTPQPSACKGILSQPEVLRNTLPGVPKFQSTYVLILSGAAKDKVPTPTSPALLDLPVEINDDPQSIAIAQDLHLTKVTRVPITEQSPVQPLVDLSSGKTDAAIVWGPLAGAGMIELGLEDKVNVFSVDRPKDPPPPFSGMAVDTENACAAAIADDIDSFGVLPAELLVPVHLRAMLNTPTPVFKMANAEKGQVVFQQICARCHGPYAIRDPTLAPVDLLVSIRRFQFIGFKYIVMNGRSQKGMPPLRGTVSEHQIALIFQYLQARSKGELAAGTTTAAAK
jgi:hypothetical protein